MERNYGNIKADQLEQEKYGITFKHIAKGLKIVHIGSDVWKIGKPSNKNGKKHQVIYGPRNKEYHLYDKQIDALETYWENDDEEKSYINRHGNKSDQAKVKIYILTNILDDKDNWCFDIKNNTPKVGKMAKIIFNNGTIKNKIFDGTWEKEEFGYSMCNPIGFRIKK